tara:strand:+ start:304 stop:537 length:234 start_codon:yes stop_codon:yes gene_type:complete
MYKLLEGLPGFPPRWEDYNDWDNLDLSDDMQWANEFRGYELRMAQLKKELLFCAKIISSALCIGCSLFVLVVFLMSM